jgi:DNA repair exonuclease SbcCD nuclease subunit
MKILSIADIHINLHKKKIPYDWQNKRFELLFERLLELEQHTDLTVISGDIFDKKPEPDEICLFLSYANSVRNETIAIPGNHEATSKGKTFLEHFTKEHSINNPNFHLYVHNDRHTSSTGQTFQLFPYGEMQAGNVPRYMPGDILVTHIRGEVPPHITAEFDFEKIRPWPLTLLGDLHFRHQYKDYNVYYPGSPLNTTFDRDDSREYGVDIIDYTGPDDYRVEFVNLKLPKLIRRTVAAGQELLSHPTDHVVYEVTGSIDNLSKIKNHELLDKKIADKPTEGSKLELINKTLEQEVNMWLEYNKIENIQAVLSHFKTLGIKL